MTSSTRKATATPYVIATKVYVPVDPDDPNGRGISRRAIIAECEKSLRRLQTDRIDLYYMHRLDPDVPVDEPLRALDDLIRAGKVRYIGTSTTAAWQFVEALWVSKARPEPLHRRDAALQHAGPADRAGAYPHGPDLRGGRQPLGAGRQRHPQRPVPARVTAPKVHAWPRRTYRP